MDKQNRIDDLVSQIKLLVDATYKIQSALSVIMMQLDEIADERRDSFDNKDLLVI